MVLLRYIILIFAVISRFSNTSFIDNADWTGSRRWSANYGINMALAANYYLPTQTTNQVDRKTFLRSAKQIKKKSRVPLRFPYYFPYENNTKFYVYIHVIDTNGYKLDLGFDSECKGQNICRYGSVSGKYLPAKKRLKGKRIRLSRNIYGYFEDAICNSYCNDSTVTWREGSYLFSVGIKAGKLKETAAAAKSAIKR